ncbi:heme exporter protein CcmD [Flexibacterium corallicola]|uniref:heme exporter protein CcmD n=1 Tax=Flexibacterium corallicola TaxID=3037259 RepID=UPI00286F4D32|nr:heme exporter protein CcmD [Pseudovibrio sp. M1P-2-3]
MFFESLFTDLPRHAGYVAACYGMAGVIMTGLVVAAFIAKKKRLAELAALEASGIRRRSAATGKK